VKRVIQNAVLFLAPSSDPTVNEKNVIIYYECSVHQEWSTVDPIPLIH